MLIALGLVLASMPSDAREAWRELHPLQLLELLQRHPGTFLSVGNDAERGFVHPEDLEPLMARLDDETPCAAVLQLVSAHVPSRRSTLGREAALLVMAFRQGYYPVVPASDLATLRLEELRAWWEDWRALPAARAWASGPGSLEIGVPYAGDFQVEGGWTPLAGLPAPMHHAVRLDFRNLDDFGHLRFGVWKQARLTFRVLRADVNPIDPPRRWNTTYVAEILRVE